MKVASFPNYPQTTGVLSMITILKLIKNVIHTRNQFSTIEDHIEMANELQQTIKPVLDLIELPINTDILKLREAIENRIRKYPLDLETRRLMEGILNIENETDKLLQLHDIEKRLKKQYVDKKRKRYFRGNDRNGKRLTYNDYSLAEQRRANDLAERANEIAESENEIAWWALGEAKKSNELAKEANFLSDRANKIARGANIRATLAMAVVLIGAVISLLLWFISLFG
jgi:hypothetical protein